MRRCRTPASSICSVIRSILVYPIYFQHFETGLSYANDLQDLAHYYSEYCAPDEALANYAARKLNFGRAL